MRNSKKGLVKVENGLRYKHDGDFWVLDQDLVTVDRHHNYSGQQDPKKPYRGAKESHVICGNKLCR